MYTIYRTLSTNRKKCISMKALPKFLKEIKFLFQHACTCMCASPTTWNVFGKMLYEIKSKSKNKNIYNIKCKNYLLPKQPSSLETSIGTEPDEPCPILFLSPCILYLLLCHCSCLG